jgi:hypothetical protein
MEQSQQKMTKQGVRDLDFGVSKKPQAVAEATSSTATTAEAEAVPVTVAVPPADAAPIQE